jgi:hypothetical protein
LVGKLTLRNEKPTYALIQFFHFQRRFPTNSQLTTSHIINALSASLTHLWKKCDILSQPTHNSWRYTVLTSLFYQSHTHFKSVTFLSIDSQLRTSGIVIALFPPTHNSCRYTSLTPSSHQSYIHVKRMTLAHNATLRWRLSFTNAQLLMSYATNVFSSSAAHTCGECDIFHPSPHNSGHHTSLTPFSLKSDNFFLGSHFYVKIARLSLR